MSLFGPPEPQGICDRCRMRMNLADMISDINSPGVRGHPRCMDELDPWRLPLRATENIALQHVRMEESLVFTPAPTPPPSPTPAPTPTPPPPSPTPAPSPTPTPPPSPSLGGEYIDSVPFAVGFAGISLWFTPDGEIKVFKDSDTLEMPAPDWFDPVTPNVGVGYWLRATAVSGDTGDVAGAFNVWQQIDEIIAYNIAADQDGDLDREATFLIELATDALGANIVNSGEFVIGAHLNMEG